ncbi:MAG: acyl-CoA/acyl-ACP dehydrogenase [bacterium]|nr:acyl-CoA dehydrogenase [Deltaproteobacteria bacterium]MCP4907720.1 acyl-CoA/acyl-ACP dehydrogenase [bacterium]
MQFNFTEDQLLLQETVRDFLQGECSVEFVREQWETETGRSPEFWARFAEIGVPGLLVPEEHGGLGMDETDLVLVLVEIGRAALAEPVVPTAAVAVPLLRDCGDEALAAAWLPKIAAGEAIVAVAQPSSPLVPEAEIADLLILRSGGGLYAVPASAARITPQKSNDPSQKLATVEFDPQPDQLIASGAEADRLEAAALDRGALACAAQQLGACEQLIAMSVEYTTERKQFGVPIGSFQAVKHQIADVKVQLEYARSHVERASHSVAREAASRSIDVSMAKISAGEAALQASSASLQVHGALGYTWEQDLHVWMRRAWTLDLAWGETAWHRERLAGALFEDTLPAESFGFTPLSA